MMLTIVAKNVNHHQGRRHWGGTALFAPPIFWLGGQPIHCAPPKFEGNFTLTNICYLNFAQKIFLTNK